MTPPRKDRLENVIDHEAYDLGKSSFKKWMEVTQWQAENRKEICAGRGTW